MRINGTDANSFTIVKPQERDIKDIDTEIKATLNTPRLSEIEKKELPVSEKVVIEAIERANKAISGVNRKFEYSVHKKTGEIMVKVINSDTNELVREIPSEKILDLVANLMEMAGLIVDERR